MSGVNLELSMENILSMEKSLLPWRQNHRFNWIKGLLKVKIRK